MNYKPLRRRSLVGCSPWDCEESDMTERLHFHFSLSCVGERNGNPLQCSCLESPGDSGARWAAVYGSHRVGHDWSDLAVVTLIVLYFFIYSSVSLYPLIEFNFFHKSLVYYLIYGNIVLLVVWSISFFIIFSNWLLLIQIQDIDFCKLILFIRFAELLSSYSLSFDFIKLAFRWSCHLQIIVILSHPFLFLFLLLVLSCWSSFPV